MKPARDNRNRELARIHCLKKELGLDDDTYRHTLSAVARVSSAADLDEFGRKAVILHLQAHVDAKRGKAHLAGADRPNNVTASQQLQKIEQQLLAAGRSWSYAIGIAERMYRKAKLEFCSSVELAGIIAALANDAKRQGRQVR